MALQIKKCCNKPSPGWPLEGFEVRRGQIGGYDLLYCALRPFPDFGKLCSILSAPWWPITILYLSCFRHIGQKLDQAGFGKWTK